LNAQELQQPIYITIKPRFESETISNFIMTITPLTSQGNIRKAMILCLMLLLFLPGTFLQAQTPEAEKNFVQCRACHNLEGPKLIGPNLSGITERRDTAWIIKFVRNSQEVIQSGDPYAVKLFEENNKIPMPPHDLTDAQIKDIIAYIGNGGKVAPEYANAAPSPEEVSEQQSLVNEMLAQQQAREEQLADLESSANRNFGATFIVTVVILLLTLFDLFVTKLIKATFVHKVVVLISLAIIGEVTYREAAALGRQQYYQPDQPIWFSHKIHASQNQIDCKYCHTAAEYSKSAGIPSTNVCMNCHNVVREGKITGTTEINKIFDAWNSGKPVEWVKIHNLPDHVFFSHAQHVNAGKLDCAECHGPIENMNVVMQVNDLSMGWCLDCHRKTEVQFAQNNFYQSYEKLHEQIKSGEIKKVTADMIGATDCMKCHY